MLIIIYTFKYIFKQNLRIMGNCCSGETVDQHGDIKTYDAYGLSRRMTARQMALLIKIQANIRGFLTRKRIRTMQINAGIGMGGYVYNEDGEIQ
jgi:NADPH-dependent curcumin reductase CurA